MPNFDVHVRRDYTDMTGLVLDLRSSDLSSIEGTHDGSDNASVLTDSSKNWEVDSLVGMIVVNVTDGSRGAITSNTTTSITATLSGGVDNDWDTGDEYTVQGDSFGVLTWPNSAPLARVQKPEYSGVHDGGDNQAVLSDSSDPWEGMDLVGMVVYNLTDGSLGWITANTASTVTATLSEGTDNDWDNGDSYLIAEPRFGNAYIDTIANQPIVRTAGGYRLLEFVKSRSTRLKLPLVHSFPLTWWTAAFEFWKGSDNTNGQVILDGNNAGVASDLQIYRRDGAGVYTMRHGGTTISGAGDHPDGAWVLAGVPAATDVDYYQEGIVKLNGAGLPVKAPAADEAMLIGGLRAGGGVNYLDGRIRTFKIWDRPMSPLEIDFLFQNLATDGADYSVQDRAVVELRVWTDDVGGGDRYPRISYKTAAPMRFLLATVDGVSRIQIAASVAGKVRPDSELGGKLFTLAWLDVINGHPLVSQDAGWSSIFDIRLDANYPGHYSCAVSREDGGSIIVHFDVEAA